MATPVEYTLRETHNAMDDEWFGRMDPRYVPCDRESIEVTMRIRCTPDEARKLVELMNGSFGFQPNTGDKPGPRGFTTRQFTR